MNGWRWHTRIAVKEFSKFRQVSLHAVTDTNAMCIRLSECYDYTWSFIFIKLLKVETEVFFPFLKAHLPNDVGRLCNKIHIFLKYYQNVCAVKEKIYSLMTFQLILSLFLLNGKISGKLLKGSKRFKISGLPCTFFKSFLSLQLVRKMLIHEYSSICSIFYFLHRTGSIAIFIQCSSKV